MNHILRRYLELGIIITLPLPEQIANGQVVDAVPVMTDLNYLATQVNANAAPLSAIPVAPVYVATVGGTANAVTLTPSTAIIAYANGQRFSFAPGTTSTGAVTVAVSGLAVTALVSKNGIALTGGELVAAGMYEIEYGPGAKFYLVNGESNTAPIAFTPIVLFGGLSTGITYGYQKGNYVKRGNLIFFTLDVALSNKGSATGTLTIGGMPFAGSVNWPTSGIGIGVATANLLTTDIKLAFAYGGGTSEITPIKLTTNGAFTALSDTDCTNNSEFLCSGVYPV